MIDGVLRPIFWHCYVAILWLALTIYPTVWFDMPVWASFLLACFWFWQIRRMKFPTIN